MNIKDIAKSRRTTEAEWRCGYCAKTFATEDGFMNHACQVRDRLDELRSVIGQAAYLYYSEWMKCYKRKPPSAETFSTSRYYRSFVNFAEHVKKLNIPDIGFFIKLMSEKDISPMLWRRDQCYTLYLQHFDKNIDPIEQVALSIETLIDISEKENVALTEVFVHIGVRTIMELIRLRKLTPWLLFCSKSFGLFLKTLTEEEMHELMRLINPTYWQEKLQLNPEVVDDIKKITEEMGV